MLMEKLFGIILIIDTIKQQEEQNIQAQNKKEEEGKNELKYNDRFVLFVMDEVEKFILKSKSGKAKKDLVIEICKKYFNDDPTLVELVIKLVFKELSQVQFIKRQGLKLVRFFLKVKRNQL